MARSTEYRLPHDRGFMLWRLDEGTHWLEESVERWVAAMLIDDGIGNQKLGGDEITDFSIISRHDGILVGAWAVDHILASYTNDVDAIWNFQDGEVIRDGDVVAIVSGRRSSILALERCILNVIAQLSGIATNTAKWIVSSSVPIACTRKTIWGLLDKWAVHMGGGLTHRLSLSDAAMLKENYLVGETGVDNSIIDLVSEITEDEIGAFLTVEVRSENEAIIAARAWSEKEPHRKCVIMLDNLGPDGARLTDVALREAGLRSNVVLEGSGGITFESLPEWTDCGIDVISTSLLNRGTIPHDFSMLIDGA